MVASGHVDNCKRRSCPHAHWPYDDGNKPESHGKEDGSGDIII